MDYTKISEVNDYLSRSASMLANTQIDCPYCGRSHKVPYQEIVIGSGVIRQVPELCFKALGYTPKKVGVVFDRAIQGIIERDFIDPFIQGGLPVTPIPLGDVGLWMDSNRELGDSVASSIPEDIDLLVAAGSGVICDLTKWIATHAHKPFILCGTAPSMNGYTSITAVISEHDIKLTKYVDIPYAVVLDTDVISRAPATMIQAGVGDLAARTICNADWKLSHYLQETYFCPLPYQMTASSEALYMASAEGIRQAEPCAIANLTEAIAISGLSMSILDGETSPSSGGEHIISHYWDFMNHIEGAPRNFHGAQVGVGTMIMLAAYDYLMELDPSGLDPDRIIRERLSLEQIQAANTTRFGAAAASLNETSQKKYLSVDRFARYIHKTLENWDQMRREISPYKADFSTIRERLQTAGLPLSLASVQRTPQQALDALLFGSRYRPRFTFLDLAWDLGLFPGAAEEILDRSGVLHG
jgi:glycerol-1-phosphate dehydrogenase [NAD(P)+]